MNLAPGAGEMVITSVRRDQDSLTLVYKDLVSFIITDGSLACHTDINDKRIQFREITNHNRIQIQKVCREILTVRQLYRGIRMTFVVSTVIRIQMYNRRACQFWRSSRPLLFAPFVL